MITKSDLINQNRRGYSVKSCLSGLVTHFFILYSIHGCLSPGSPNIQDYFQSKYSVCLAVLLRE